MKTPVVWWRNRFGNFDHGLVADLLHTEHRRPNGYDFERVPFEAIGAVGCVLVVPTRGMEKPEVEEVRRFVNARSWCLVFAIGDEETRVPVGDFKLPNSLVWAQTPRPENLPKDVRPMFLGAPIRTRELVQETIGVPAPPKTIEWAFFGQAGHAKRDECIGAMRAIDDANVNVSGGFTQGLPRELYLARLAATKLAPSPSGPETPDCFRTWEALEVGALPVVDKSSPRRSYPNGYYVFANEGARVPFPSVSHWDEFHAIVEQGKSDPLELKRRASFASAWWARKKRDYAKAIDRDLFAVSGVRARNNRVADKLTILMPTSPIPSHPDDGVIEDSIARLRGYAELDDAEIVIMFDGVPAKLAHRAEAYEEYKRRIMWRIHFDPLFENVRPLVFERPTHQANMTRAALRDVDTPLVMFVEHDTWPCGEIPFGELCRLVETNDQNVNVVRLQHYGGDVHPEHRYLLARPERVEVCGVPLYLTRQWSQRPHIARADFYRRIIAQHFDEKAWTMIEDVVHGPCAESRWSEFGVAIYAPPGDMKRSETCDGRGTDPKFEDDFTR